ncbi:MAG: DUF3971 domain-containing protein [Pseudomonadota bacterium]
MSSQPDTDGPKSFAASAQSEAEVFNPDAAAATLGARPAPTVETPAPPQRPKGTRRKKAVKTSFWALRHTFALVTLFGLGILVAIVLSMGRPIAAPNWMRAELNAQIAQSIPGHTASIDRLYFVLRENLGLEVLAADMQVRDSDGLVVADLSDVSVEIHRSGLLSRQLDPKSVEISGLQLGIRRNRDGQFNIALGPSADLSESLDLSQLLASFDQAFESPVLAGLERVEGEALSIRYEDLQTGRAYLADGGRFRFSQTDSDARLRADIAVLSGADTAASLDLTIDLPKDAPGAAIGLKVQNVPARDLAGQTAILSWLSVLDAPISGALRFSLSDDGGLGPLFGTLEIAQGSVRPTQTTRPIPFDAARTYFAYNPRTAALQFDEVFIDSPALFAQGTGKAYLDADIGEAPQAVLGQFQLEELRAKPSILVSTETEFDVASVDFRLNLAPFSVDIGEAILRPQGVSGGSSTLKLSGRIDAAQDGWRVGLKGAHDRMEIEDAMRFWPEAFRPNVRKWFANNLKVGQFFNTQSAIRFYPNEPPRVLVSSEFTATKLQFLKSMPPIEEGSGFVSFEGKGLSVTVTDGFVEAPSGGRTDIAGSHFVIPDATVPQAPAQVHLVTKGPVTAALSLLDQPPLRVMQKANLSVETFDGTAELTGVLRFPLKKRVTPDEVKFDFAGVVKNVATDKLMPRRRLEALELSIRADNTGVELTGPLELDGVAAQATWRQPMGKNNKGAGSTVTAQVALDADAFETFGVSLPPGSVSGSTQADLTVTLPKGAPPKFVLSSDLRGLRMALTDLSWSKSAQQTGRLEVEGTTGAVPDISRLSLRASGLEASGRVALRSGGQLDAARFENVKLRDWLDARVSIVGRGAGRAPEVVLQGGTIDLRKTTFGGDGGTGQGGPLVLNLDRLIVTEGLELTNLRGQFSTQGAFNGAFTALVNGKAPIQGSLAPGGTGTAIRVIAQDAGSVLSAAETLKQGRGGTLELILRPVQAKGSYDGTLKVEDIRVQDAPALAGLLSAVSVIGLLDQMAAGGILFTDVDANFRISPDRLTLLSSSATGPAIGVSMDGQYTLGSGALDMQGVLSPIYALNGIGQIFTRRGEGLIGFNFTIKGDKSQPRVGVNPFSLFTPGMFREIFRRPPPTVE